jgi:hypothetical protein
LISSVAAALDFDVELLTLSPFAVSEIWLEKESRERKSGDEMEDLWKGRVLK